ncbi:MAG: C39 family peptidase [Minisyncoccota bacterium]
MATLEARLLPHKGVRGQTSPNPTHPFVLHARIFNVMKLSVQYYSQFLDVKDPAWKLRACGIACLKMLLETEKVKTPSLDQMIQDGVALGAYGPSGWIHSGLIALAGKYGVNLSRAEWRTSDTKIADKLNKEGIAFLVAELRARRPVIVSAIRHFKEVDKFHMVTLVGFKGRGLGVAGFYYHDPDSLTREGGEHQFVPIETFRSAWRKMAIFRCK